MAQKKRMSRWNTPTLRSTSAPAKSFANSCLYEFVQRFRKTTITRANRDRTDETLPQPPRARNTTGSFMQEHPHAATHQLSQMTAEAVPVILGPTIPHPDKGRVDKEQWARAMLILFKPWRTPDDLKAVDESWTEAYEAFEPAPDLKCVIKNMLVLHECKDARNSDMSKRNSQPSFVGGDDDTLEEMDRLVTVLDMNEAYEMVSGDVERCAEHREGQGSIEKARLARALGVTSV